MNAVERVSDLIVFNQVARRFDEESGFRDRYDGAKDDDAKRDIEHIVNILARYIEVGNAPFHIVPESSPKNVGPEEGAYKMSMMVPKTPVGARYWDNCVNCLDSEAAKNKLFLYYTPNGYKTIDMQSGIGSPFAEDENMDSSTIALIKYTSVATNSSLSISEENKIAKKLYEELLEAVVKFNEYSWNAFEGSIFQKPDDSCTDEEIKDYEKSCLKMDEEISKCIDYYNKLKKDILDCSFRISMTTVSKSYALLDKLFRSVFYYEDDGKHEEKHVISEWRIMDKINFSMMPQRGFSLR